MKYYHAFHATLGMAKSGAVRAAEETKSALPEPLHSPSNDLEPGHLSLQVRDKPRKPQKPHPDFPRQAADVRVGGRPGSQEPVLAPSENYGTEDLLLPDSSGEAGRPTDWRQEVNGWSPDLREAWEERAAIMEYEGGYPRITAERLAYFGMKSRQESVMGSQPVLADKGEMSFWEAAELGLPWRGFYPVGETSLDSFKSVIVGGDAASSFMGRLRQNPARNEPALPIPRPNVLNCLRGVRGITSDRGTGLLMIFRGWQTRRRTLNGGCSRAWRWWRGRLGKERMDSWGRRQSMRLTPDNAPLHTTPGRSLHLECLLLECALNLIDWPRVMDFLKPHANRPGTACSN